MSVVIRMSISIYVNFSISQDAHASATGWIQLDVEASLLQTFLIKYVHNFRNYWPFNWMNEWVRVMCSRRSGIVILCRLIHLDAAIHFMRSQNLFLKLKPDNIWINFLWQTEKNNLLQLFVKFLRRTTELKMIFFSFFLHWLIITFCKTWEDFWEKPSISKGLS